MPLFRRFFCTVAREGGRRSQLPARSRSTTSAARTTRTHARASTALKSRTNRTARARKQSTMPHALAATSRPAMTVRAFEIAGTNARHTAWTLMARPRGFTARRVLRRALARDTMRAEHVSRARARTPRSRLARTRVRRTRTTDAWRPESSASFLTAERRQPPRPAGFSRRSGSDRDPSNVQYRRRFVPRARPHPSRRPPRALARSEARAPASPRAHQVRKQSCYVSRDARFPRDFANALARPVPGTRGYPAHRHRRDDSKHSHLHPNKTRTGTAGFARARAVVKVRPAGTGRVSRR